MNLTTEDIFYKERYERKFKEQEELIKRQLMPGEEYKHCLDWDSWGGRYYCPCWVVTSEGRVWSLWFERFNTPYFERSGNRNANGEYFQGKYYYQNGTEQILERFGIKRPARCYVHCLVANYFCDKTAIELFGEEHCKVHHIFGYDWDADCMWQNRAKHIQYVKDDDHVLLNAIQKKTQRARKLLHDAEKEGEDTTYLRLLLENGAFESDGYKLKNGISLTYDSKGKKTLKTIIPISGGHRFYR